MMGFGAGAPGLQQVMGGGGAPFSGGQGGQPASLASLPPWMQGRGGAPQGVAPQMGGLAALGPYLGHGGYSGMGGAGGTPVLGQSGAMPLGSPRPQFNPAILGGQFAGGQVPQLPQFAGQMAQFAQGFNPQALGARFAGGLGALSQAPVSGTTTMLGG